LARETAIRQKTTARKEVEAMLIVEHTVDIGAGPATPADRSELGQILASGAPQLAAALERAEAPPSRASVSSGLETRENMVPYGWFG
jgi:hypothetical protein